MSALNRPFLLTLVLLGVVADAVPGWAGRAPTPRPRAAALVSAHARRLAERARRSNASQKIVRVAGKVKLRVRMPLKVKRVFRAASKRCRLLQGRCTLTVDHLEGRLPPQLATTLDRVRLVSPSVMTRFMLAKLKQDPRFLVTFRAASSIGWHLALPVAIYLGVSPTIAMVGYNFGAGPLNIAVIVLRLHQLRADRSQSIWGTMRGLGEEYKEIARVGRERNRRYVRLRRRLDARLRKSHDTTLHELGQQLAAGETGAGR